MRVYWIVLLASFVGGGFGAWALWSDTDQYTSTLRTYSQVDVTYAPGTFVWRDPEFNNATLQVRVRNDSPVQATVENIDVSVRFDGDFAGSSYERFRPVELAAGEERLLDFTIQVTAGSVRARGGSAELTVHGRATVAFQGLERDLLLPVSGAIGVVPWSEQ